MKVLVQTISKVKAEKRHAELTRLGYVCSEVAYIPARCLYWFSHSLNTVNFR